MRRRTELNKQDFWRWKKASHVGWTCYPYSYGLTAPLKTSWWRRGSRAVAGRAGIWPLQVIHAGARGREDHTKLFQWTSRFLCLNLQTFQISTYLTCLFPHNGIRSAQHRSINTIIESGKQQKFNAKQINVHTEKPTTDGHDLLNGPWCRHRRQQYLARRRTCTVGFVERKLRELVPAV